MKPNVRILSDKNVVNDASVEIRTEDEEGNDLWHQISHAVAGISWDVSAGDISEVTLRLITANVRIEGLLSDETYTALADTLRQRGYTVNPPDEVVDVTTFGTRGSRRFIPGLGAPLPDCDAEDRSARPRTV